MRIPGSLLSFLTVLLAVSAFAEDAEHATSLIDFEQSVPYPKFPEDGPGAVALTTEWASDGKQSLKIDPGLTTVFEQMSTTDWSAHSLLRFHFKNPSPQTVEVGLEILDPLAKGYWNRHINAFGVLPGEQAVDIDFSGGLWRSELNNKFRGDVKTPIDLTHISRFAIENRGKSPLSVDRIELVKVKKLATAGGFAFDFGRKGSQVMGQFLGVDDGTAYDASRGYGLTNGASSLHNDMSYPTPMLGDGLHWSDGFRVDLPAAGKYLGLVAFERGGFWGPGEDTSYTKLAMTANGAVVHHHDFSRDGMQFQFQDTDLTEAEEIIDKLVWPAHAVSRFTFDAAAGANLFKVATEQELGFPIRVAGLILAPDTDAGRAFLAEHEALQRRTIATTFTPQDRGRRADGRAAAKKLTCAPMAVGEQMYPHDWPAASKDAPRITIAAVPGQTAAVQLGVYAAKNATATAAAAAPKGPSALSAPRVSNGRYLSQRPYGTGAVWIEINNYRPEPTFTVGPQISRPVLVEFTIPGDAKPGEYTSEISVTAAGESARIPVTIRVVAAKLATIPIPLALFNNAVPFGPEYTDEATWWRLQESLLREQASAGLTMVTGGPGLGLEVSADGGTITGDRALKYLDLARSLGMEQGALGYGGFVSGVGSLPADRAKVARTIDAFEKAHHLPTLYMTAYDEPTTPAERTAALERMAGAKAAGLHAVGFTSADWADPAWVQLVTGTFAPACNLHDRETFAKITALGSHPWSYNQGPDRYGFGIHLWRQLSLGCEGRSDWIGTYVMGFAFYNLDGREPSQACFAIHKTLGVLATPQWLSARQGLLDARLLLALKAVKPDDPVFARIGLDGYCKDREKWTDAEMESVRTTVLDHLAMKR
ncbi:MAG: hypothetical protein H0U85_04305 [Gemmatimonadales bacterium]|nr:hypothetical protein [Gemmatimonadales bacterium]MBA3709312.1 hypothetical protein [Planctomycetota bacterium]